MSRNLKEKIALGVPLTDQESKELLTDSKALQLAEGMHSIDLLAESIRHEKPSTEVLARIRFNDRQTDAGRRPGSNWASSLAYSVAALFILFVPLGVIIGSQQFSAGSSGDVDEIDRASRTSGIGILTYGRDSATGELEPLYTTLGMPFSSPQSKVSHKPATKPGPSVGFVPIKFWEHKPELDEALRTYASLRDQAALSYDEPMRLAQLWIGRKPSTPRSIGSFNLEINRRATKLKGWRIDSAQSPRWVIAYGSRIGGFVPRLDFWEKREGKATLVLRQDCFPFRGDFLGHKVLVAPPGQKAPGGSLGGLQKPPQ